jgi:hypothetical protein
MHLRRYIHALAILFAFLFIITAAYYHLKQPMYDWDMLAYSAIQYKMQGVPDSQIQKVVYDVVYSALDSSTKAFLSEKPLEIKAMKDVEFFMEQLPFYEIKPGYNFLVFSIAYLIKCSPIKAMQYVSVGAFVITSLFILYYLQQYFSSWILFILTASVTSISTLSISARMFTPDMLSVCILMPVFYMAMSRRRVHLIMMYFLLILSITIRPDNVLWIIALPILYYVINRNIHLISFNIVGVCIGVFVYLFIGYYYQGYGWKITFQHSAIDLGVKPSYWFNIPLTIVDYLKALTIGILTYKTKFVFAVFIAVLTYFSIYKITESERPVLLLWWSSNVSLFVAKFLLFPVFDDRYYLLSILLASLLIIRAIIPSSSSLNMQKQ